MLRFRWNLKKRELVLIESKVTVKVLVFNHRIAVPESYRGNSNIQHWISISSGFDPKPLTMQVHRSFGFTSIA